MPPQDTHPPHGTFLGEVPLTSAEPTTPFAHAPSPFPPLQDRLLGDYELLERIGRGGLGEVHRARHRVTDAIVAVKVVRATDASPAERRCFAREIIVARRLTHPNLLPVLASGEHDGLPWYAMPLIAGGSLDKRLRDGPLDLRWTVTLLAKVSRAMQVTHDRGIVHRDLKPGNILLGDADEPLIADFGLARLLDSSTGLTLTGQLMGSIPYMSPEQASGHSHHATPRSDTWSLGVILYEMLAGVRPFRGRTHTEVLRHIQQTEPAPLRQVRPELPADLERICMRCLRKEPGERYASAARLADDLEHWLRGEPVAQPPRRRKASAWRALLVGGAVLVALVTAFPSRQAAVALPEDRARSHLADRLRLAKADHPVSLLAANQRPLWSEIVFGAGSTKLTTLARKPVWLNCPRVALLELLPPNVNRGPYRLTVELEQTDGDDSSIVGIYVGRKVVSPPKGQGHLLLLAGYCDPAFEQLVITRRPGYQPKLEWKLTYVKEDVAKRDVNTYRESVGPRLDHPPGQQTADRCLARTLVLEVPPALVTPRRLAVAWKLLHKDHPEFPAQPAADFPTGGAGVFVHRGTVQVHRVLYEPLTTR